MAREPNEIFASTTPQVKKMVTKILEIEKEYQHFQDLKSAKKLDEVKNRLIKIIEQEINE